jgi:hypothetical protein
MIDLNYLIKIFSYKDGLLIRNKTGKEASPNSLVKGYKTVKIKNKNYKQHRIIFYICNGYLPNFIDHIDRNKLNNNSDNLRPSVLNGNNHNISIPCHNSSGYKGVYWYKPRNRWRSMIKINKKQITLGNFKTKQEAAIAYNEAAIKYHGEFASLNII